MVCLKFFEEKKRRKLEEKVQIEVERQIREEG